MKSFVISLDDPRADLSIAGGKGESLSRLARAGLPVPGGFIVTTAAYGQFIAQGKAQREIVSLAGAADPSRPDTLEAAATGIAGIILGCDIPDAVASAVVSAYRELGKDKAVAVRSSATAEDLPGASFAGQLDSFLNVRGEAEVLNALRKCWASLWTGRAIAYRIRQGIPPGKVSLAVVVQLLVPAQVSGILFTANPVTGRRNEAVINASWGLGEAVVGGLVSPDTLTVDTPRRRIIRRETAEKTRMSVRTEQGTREVEVPERLRRRAVLSRRQALVLIELGERIERLYRTPMDIEWAMVNNVPAILQARPITSLKDEPLDWKPPVPGGIYMRSSVVDLMPSPLSPLFATLALPEIVAQLQLVAADLTRSNPSLPDNYYTVINHYGYMNVKFSLKNLAWILFGLFPSYPRMLKRLIPYWKEEALPRYASRAAEAETRDLGESDPDGLWNSVLDLTRAFGLYTSALLFATMGASAGSEALLTRLYLKMICPGGNPPASVLLMGWDSLPMRAEKSLFELARNCRKDETLTAFLLEADSGEIARLLMDGSVPPGLPGSAWETLRHRFLEHLEAYGYMIFQLDFAQALPRENPSPMLEVIKMYLRGEGVDPLERQEKNIRTRNEVAQAALQSLKGPRLWLFRKVLGWAQSISEVREDALAQIGLAYPPLRAALRRLGQVLVQADGLAVQDDVYWLEKQELEQAIPALATGEPSFDFRIRVEERKASVQKASQSAPPPILPPRKKVMGFDTSLFLAETEANSQGSVLSGVAAGTGRVSAPACVMDGPGSFNRMRQGDIIVAATTTPAWTPLFAMASGVVTDIGGPLSHGSIVAREYGIPAVMGTGLGTRRIKDGQTITVDGDAGTVTLGPERR